MASQRITVRVPKNLGTRLRDQSRARGQTPSDVVRAALESYLAQEAGSVSAYEKAKRAGLIGIVRGAPKDLSTNPVYMEGFGKGK
jgi:metal-responsive CopG/Arc/MetJ family transcriptional regulator